MSKQQINARISDNTRAQLDALCAAMNETQTGVITIAIDRMAQAELSKENTMTTYDVIEDNAGGMFLFFFDNGNVILGVENIEHAEPGDLDSITLEDARYWDSQLDDPQGAYDDITGHQFGWNVVANHRRQYPARMGRAAQRVFGIDAE